MTTAPDAAVLCISPLPINKLRQVIVKQIVNDDDFKCLKDRYRKVGVH